MYEINRKILVPSFILIPTFYYCIYTFTRVARRMTSVPITYSPRHSWHSLSKQFSNTSQREQMVRRFIRVKRVRTCECSYTCENIHSHRDRHTNVRASAEARHEHKCVNVVLGAESEIHHFPLVFHFKKKLRHVIFFYYFTAKIWNMSIWIPISWKKKTAMLFL